jgi:hypothetical protein
MKKQEVLELLDEFPEDEVDPEELIHRLYLKEKLERAEEAVRSGDLLSHEELVERSQQWFQ